MKISTKGRYGVRFMLDLAIHYNQGLIPLKDIAKRQEISVKYLEQILLYLNKTGCIRSARGAHGGYALCCDPKAVTVGMILRLIEGSISPVDCAEQNPPLCSQASTCITIGVWKKIKNAIDDVVDNITLADLVEEYNSKNHSDFCI